MPFSVDKKYFKILKSIFDFWKFIIEIIFRGWMRDYVLNYSEQPLNTVEFLFYIIYLRMPLKLISETMLRL